MSDEVKQSSKKLKPTLYFRFYRPKGADDMELKLQQKHYDPMETQDVEDIWLDVPKVMED